MVRKNSKKRDAILNELASSKQHPTAEALYTALKPQLPDLSLGTVYRNLALFMEEGRICSVGVVNGHEHYDGNVLPHPHFVCSGCGAVIDVDVPMPDPAAYRGLLEAQGMTVDHCSLTITGLCSSCNENVKNQQLA